MSSPTLPPECPGSLAEAVETVLAAWAEQGAMSPRSQTEYSLMLNRFTKFAAANGITTLEGVDKDLAEAFITALGRNREGHVIEPKSGTAAVRRSALRCFYQAALSSGWTAKDPTARVHVRQNREILTRPLTDDESERVRFLAESVPHSITATMVNLLLSGVGVGEVGGLRVSDCAFNGDHASVRLPSSGGHKARVIKVEGYAAITLANRIAHLEKTSHDGQLCGKASGSRKEQSKTSVRVRQVLARAGLNTDPRVKPTSLTAWAARKAYETTGRIEDAAKLIGYSSLDITARFIGWDWNNAEGAAES